MHQSYEARIDTCTCWRAQTSMSKRARKHPAGTAAAEGMDMH